jgi:hypothetical protein
MNEHLDCGDDPPWLPVVFWVCFVFILLIL